MQATFITRNQARKSYGISSQRLEAAIKNGEVEARYTGTRTAKVSATDIERIIKTPPSAVAA